MMLSLAEEIVLLAYGDDGRPHGTARFLPHGVGGACLLELVVAGRVAVDGDLVTVVDRAPTGMATVDAALERLAAEKAMPARQWVVELGRDGTDAVLDRLVAAGVLERVRDRVLLVFPRTRFPSPHGAEPAEETGARRRMAAAVAGDGPVDARTAALCVLVGALGWDGVIFPDVPAPRLRERLARLRDGAGVTGALAAVEAAVAIAAVLPAVIT
ncbi:GOLPH3/VPS74 family protein [Catenuloplanes atrovinosus]|uniref:GPP34 family phosphoprotein n=1 Tax=Catenuloplanes atrovinosus TaxID=137266 RepID=A0AAE4CBA5_9ACTN|nr:GPP34 family phosphoprotein [Catenuloplanes atrovinosus]MDR7276659.1 hypothetical protein [Catenuloplanes atrovinosus]